MNKTLKEELNRYNAINNYGKKLFLEQELPLPAETPAEDDPNAAPAPAPAPDMGAPAAPAGDLPLPGGDPMTAPDAGIPPAPDAGTDPALMGGDMGDTTEEIDITDLVNMTKSIKRDMEMKQDETSNVVGKMNDVFSKLDELESKLGQMDMLVSKIESLGAKIEQSKPATPVEKLEMRSLDSYPFSQNPQQFFSIKQDEMRQSGKNEYVLTKQDVDDYSKEQIRKTFNPSADENYTPRF